MREQTDLIAGPMSNMTFHLSKSQEKSDDNFEKLFQNSPRSELDKILKRSSGYSSLSENRNFPSFPICILKIRIIFAINGGQNEEKYLSLI